MARTSRRMGSRNDLRTACRLVPPRCVGLDTTCCDKNVGTSGRMSLAAELPSDAELEALPSMLRDWFGATVDEIAPKPATADRWATADGRKLMHFFRTFRNQVVGNMAVARVSTTFGMDVIRAMPSFRLITFDLGNKPLKRAIQTFRLECHRYMECYDALPNILFSERLSSSTTK